MLCEMLQQARSAESAVSGNGYAKIIPIPVSSSRGMRSWFPVTIRIWWMFRTVLAFRPFDCPLASVQCILVERLSFCHGAQTLVGKLWNRF